MHHHAAKPSFLDTCSPSASAPGVASATAGCFALSAQPVLGRETSEELLRSFRGPGADAGRDDREGDDREGDDREGDDREGDDREGVRPSRRAARRAWRRAIWKSATVAECCMPCRELLEPLAVLVTVGEPKGGNGCLKMLKHLVGPTPPCTAATAGKAERRSPRQSHPQLVLESPPTAALARESTFESSRNP